MVSRSPYKPPISTPGNAAAPSHQDSAFTQHPFGSNGAACNRRDTPRDWSSTAQGVLGQITVSNTRWEVYFCSPHSHSIVLSDRNALNSKRKIFFCTRRRTVSPIRHKFPLLNSKEIFADSESARFRRLSASIGQFSQPRAKVIVQLPIEKRPSPLTEASLG